ncbi:MAG: GSU2403 family nucleotidyltransferase fold protein [Rhodospirillaceae bacterium]
MYLKELTGEQRRQLIDTQQVYAAWREAYADHGHRFAGSMRWAERHGREYLLRKIGTRETSLGARASGTEASYEAFMTGRDANQKKLDGLVARLEEIAPVNRAMGLGRMPSIAARIARRCDDQGLLGQQLFIVGANALYAYEAIAGVQLESGLVASGDIDLLYDSRRHLSLTLKESLSRRGLIGLLQSVDRSFSTATRRNFRASNQDGYLVDLIRPQAKDVMRDNAPAALTELADDLEGAAIFGLAWLINAPKLEALVIDEKGLPARLVVIDPRVFALHKAWIAERDDREPVKAVRDRGQAAAAALLATRYLRLKFEDDALSAVPAALRERAPALAAAAQKAGSAGEALNW